MAIFLLAHYVDFLESLLEYFIEREGLDVVISENVGEISKMARKKDAFHIVKCINSDDFSDSERLKELREEFPSLKVFGIFIDEMSDELRKYYKQCGADRIYRYPCDWDETMKEVIDLTVQN